ncbi:MAG: hypothetical protein RLZZ529_1829 [Bacteroidota bacterium]|jgi:hypothetical protein
MLKKLTILSLIILALPFFQTCSDKNIMENSFLKNSPLQEELIKPTETKIVNGKEIEISQEKEYKYTFKELTEKKKETIRKFISLKKEMTSNGYQLAFQFVIQIQPKDIINTIDYKSLPFFLTLIITCLLIYFSFKREPKIILILSISNFIILITHIFLLYLSDYLEDFEQVKYGYYLFLINLVLIIIESFKEKINNKTTSPR